LDFGLRRWPERAEHGWREFFDEDEGELGEGRDAGEDDGRKVPDRRSVKTLGGDFQADAETAMGGVNGLLSTQLGIFGGDFAVSRARGYGTGWAGSMTFERLFSGAGTFDLRFEKRSRNFAPLGSVPPSNPFAWEASGAISRTFGDRFYAGADVSYSKGRGALPNRAYYRANAGFQLAPRLEFELDGTYEVSPEYKGFSLFATLTFRASERSTGRADRSPVRVPGPQ